MRKINYLSALLFAGLAFSPVSLSQNVTHEFTPGPQATSPQQPQVTVASDGAIYLVYGSENDIFCTISHDNGKTFSSPVKFSSGGVLSLGRHRGPRIVATHKYVVIAAIVGSRGRGQDGNLLAWRSEDQGRTWSAPVIANDAPDSAREGLHCMTAGPENLVFAAWLDLRGEGTEPYGAVSFDGGRTWRRNTRIYRSPNGTICQCCHPSAAIDSMGKIHVMWRNVLDGSRDIFVASSTDGGFSFSAATKLGEGTWPLNTCPMDGGDLAVSPSNAVETVWRRNDEIFLASSDKPELPLGKGKDPVIAFGHKRRYVAWQDSMSKSLMLLAPGKNDPIPLGNRGSYIDLAAGPQGILVAAWEEGEPGHKTIKLQVLR